MADFSITIEPRSYETDALGHINNNAITAWFEVLRVKLIGRLGEDIPMAQNWVLVSLAMDFLDETFYGRDVVITATEVAAGNSSLTIHCWMAQDGRRTVEGRAVLVHLDPETKRPAPIPDPFRERVAGL
jgi:acyl-CoA thioester hydrolase